MMMTLGLLLINRHAFESNNPPAVACLFAVIGLVSTISASLGGVIAPMNTPERMAARDITRFPGQLLDTCRSSLER